MGRHHLVKTQSDGRVPLAALGDHVKNREFLVLEEDDGTITLHPRTRHVYEPPEESW